MPVETYTYTQGAAGGGGRTVEVTDIVVWPPGLQVPTGPGVTVTVREDVPPGQVYGYWDGHTNTTRAYLSGRGTTADGPIWGQAPCRLLATSDQPASGPTWPGARIWPLIPAGRRTVRGLAGCPYASPAHAIGEPALPTTFPQEAQVVRCFRGMYGDVMRCGFTLDRPVNILKSSMVTISGCGEGFDGDRVVFSAGLTVWVDADPGAPATGAISPTAGRLRVEASEYLLLSRNRGRMAYARPLWTTTDEVAGEGLWTPYKNQATNLRGAALAVIAQLWTGDQDGDTATGATTGVRLLAPFLPRQLPDLAVDADCPAPFGQCRVVWAAGAPYWVARTNATNPPRAGYSERRQRQRTNSEWFSGDAQGDRAPSAQLAGHGAEPYQLITPCSVWEAYYPRGGCGIRGRDLVAMHLGNCTQSFDVSLEEGHETVTATAKYRWVEADHQDPTTYYLRPGTALGGGWTTMGHEVVVAGSTATVKCGRLDLGTPPQVDNDVPRLRCIQIEITCTYEVHQYDWENGTDLGYQPYTQTRTLFLDALGQDNGEAALVRPATVGAPSTWPWDIPRLALAADDDTCRYVGSAGWATPPHGQIPAPTWTDATLTRDATSVTLTSWGVCTYPTDPLINVSGSGIQAGSWRLWCPETGDLIAANQGSPWSVTIPEALRDKPLRAEVDATHRAGSGYGGAIWQAHRSVVDLPP